jgi:type I restriction enzyme S subunit
MSTSSESHSAIRRYIDDLPSEWSWTSLGEILTEVTLRARDERGVSLPVLSLTKSWGLIPQERRFDHRVAIDDVSEYKVVRPGWIAYNPMVIWEGAIAALPGGESGVVSPAYVIWDSTGADWRFMDFLLRSPMVLAEFERLCSGVVKRRRTLRKSQFVEISLPLPPRREQVAIADVLQTVRRAKETTEATIAASQELKKSLLHHLFRFGPVPIEEAATVHVKDTAIGPLPSGWNVVELDEVLESRLGKMLSGAARTGKSPHKYLRNKNVQWGHFDLAEVAEMDFTQGELTKYELKEGDVLVCEGGEVGRCAVWHQELPGALFQKALHRVRPRNERISSDFFAYHMMFAFKITGMYGTLGTTTTIAHLPGDKLKPLKIPLPPRELQDRIVDNIRAVEAKLVAEEGRRDALAALFDSLLHDLITGKRRVRDSRVHS